MSTDSLNEIQGDPDTSAALQSPSACESRVAISRILDITLNDDSFKSQLKGILDVVVSLSWLRAKKQGAIFVANCREELVLTVHHSFSPELQKKCAKVPFGTCLCGRAASERKIIFKDCIDGEHGITFEGMKPHGHYNLPLLDHDKVIGVIVLYINHGHSPHPEERPFMEMLSRTVSSFIQHRSLRVRSEVSGLRLMRAQQDMMQRLVAASEYRDHETGAHIKRMSQYSVILGRAIGLDQNQLTMLKLAAPMHDIGKVGIPDSILLKPGRLTEEEFGIMKEHTSMGGKLLEGEHPLLHAGRDIALSHHERWDGKGYPKGLKGEEIPLFGRICALADVFDALTSARPYKEPWSVEKAAEFVSDNAGTHFDPTLVSAFLASLPEILETKAFYEEGNDADAALVSWLSAARLEREYLPWSPSLELGIPIVDQQHQFLVNLINRVHAAVEHRDTLRIVNALLDMRTYAEVHFRDEERLMEAAHYPDIDRHRKQHAGFIRQTGLFLDELEEAPLAVSVETLSFLTDWLVQHIQGTDREYAPCLHGHRAVGPHPPPAPRCPAGRDSPGEAGGSPLEESGARRWGTRPQR